MEKEKILIVDDSEMNRSILADMLMDDYDILEAADGQEAVQILMKTTDISLVLLDIVMPKMDGFEVLNIMNQNNWIEDMPVIMVSAENSPTQVERAYDLGATDFIMRPFDALIVRRRVINTLLLYAKQKQLVRAVENQILEKERHSGMLIDILSNVVEFRNGESGSHVFHVRRLTDFFLHTLVSKTDRYELSSADISRISIASALHDIGKIAIDGSILNKPGKLTPEEFEIMKTHTTLGGSILDVLPAYHDDPLVRVSYEICRWHHERYDGRGYPDGLAGDDIPISAQVVALADVYDALTSQRVYKPAFSHEKAQEMILNGECGAFNSLLLECLSENGERIRKLMQEDIKEFNVQRETKELVNEALHNESLSASARTLSLLDYERMKFDFFISVAEEISFEYTATPSMLSLSAWGAKKLGVDEIIMDPGNDGKLNTVLDEYFWSEIKRRVSAATPEKPDISFECRLFIGGEDQWYRLVARTLWSEDNPPVCRGLWGKAIDIHATRMKMEELAQKAARDSMTGLLNRESAREQIELRMGERVDSCFALVVFDLDYFKTANDTFGHSFGDEVLKFVSRKLVHSVRGTDLCCRAGGDEFMLFLEYRTDIEKTIDRIFHSLCGDYKGFHVSLTMGVALAEHEVVSYEELFQSADTALYAAKRDGRGRYYFYDDSMHDLLMVKGDTMTEVESDRPER